MKCLIRTFFFFGLIAAMAVACQKNSSTANANKSQVTLSKQTVKIGEPLIASTNAASPGLFTKWSVSPQSNTWVSSPSGNQSVILFSKSGGYTVTASYFTDSSAPAPYDSSSSPVTVSDSVYNSDSATAHCNVIA